MHLTAEQLARFEHDGYLAPLLFRVPERMDAVRATIDDASRTSDSDRPEGWAPDHHDCRAIYDICASPEIVDPVADLLGPDVILWNSTLIEKEPGGAEIPWHQDRDFLLLNPPVNIAAWLAIDDADVENGCLEVLPGSHRQRVPHIPRAQAHEFDARVDANHVDPSRAVSIELRAGQFVLFHGSIVHHSPMNRSSRRRSGLVMRYTKPGVSVRVEDFYEGYAVYPVRGQDRFGLNPIGAAPRPSTIARCGDP